MFFGAMRPAVQTLPSQRDSPKIMIHPYQDSVSEDRMARNKIVFARLRSLIVRRDYATARDISALLDTSLEVVDLTARIKNERFAYQLDHALSKAHLVCWSTYRNLAASTLLCGGSTADDLAILMNSPSVGKPEFLSSLYRAHHSHTNCEANLVVLRELINFDHQVFMRQLGEVMMFSDETYQMASFYKYLASNDQTVSDMAFAVCATNFLDSPSIVTTHKLVDAAIELIGVVEREYFAVDVISQVSHLLLQGASTDEFSSMIAFDGHYTDAVRNIQKRFDWISFSVTGTKIISGSDLLLPNYGLNPSSILQASLWITDNYGNSSWRDKESLLTLIRSGLEFVRTDDRWLASWIQFEAACLDHASGTAESEHFVLGRDFKPIDSTSGRHWLATAKAMIRTGKSTMAASILEEVREIGSGLSHQLRESEETLSSLLSLIGRNVPSFTDAKLCQASPETTLESGTPVEREFSGFLDLAKERESKFLRIAAHELREPSEFWTTVTVSSIEKFLEDLANHHGTTSLSVFVGRFLAAQIFSSIDPRLSVRLYRQIRSEQSCFTSSDDSFRWHLADLETRCLYLLGRDREAAEGIREELKRGFESARRASVVGCLVTAINSLENMQDPEGAYRLSSILGDLIGIHNSDDQSSDVYLCLARTHESNGFHRDSLEFLKRAESVLDSSLAYNQWISIISRLAETSDRISDFVLAAHYWNLLAEQNPRTADYYSRRAIASEFHLRAISS
ncbi:hypothetical protein ACIGB6_20625 [Paeniglutamicibacter gangotriensis]|uniref:hypothetical protein n=1 Tax=Paeniglutamicibacter gangotriensis TaxID=254787 RepID=UPI0037C55ADF